MAIHDVTDDPRIEYPEAAKKEGIASILSVPMMTGGRTIGAMRVYTSEPWDFALNDVNLQQALAQIAGMALDMCRLYKGYKESLYVLKTLREAQKVRTARRNPFPA